MLKLKTLLEATSDNPEAEIQNLVTKVSNYDEFVKQLGDLVNDPKIQAFIKSGKADGSDTDDKLTASTKNIKVTELHPTQNEIDVDKSLKYPLTIPTALRNCLEKGPRTLKAPIVTYNGKYIIDGHHRWSQLYAMNKNAEIVAIDLSGKNLKPVDVLKVVQLSIGAELGKVPTAEVKGKNLLKQSGDDVAKYVISTITPECVKMFKMMKHISTAQDIAGKIVVPNVMEMQKTSQPVPGAPKRDVMPQTDDAPEAIANIAKGIINYNKPYAIGESIQKQNHKSIKQNNMKKSQLKQIIKEEIKSVLKEADIKPIGPDGNTIDDATTVRNLNMALKAVTSSIRPKVIALIQDPEAARALTNPGQKAAVLGAIAIAFGISEKDFSQITSKIKGVLKKVETQPNEKI